MSQSIEDGAETVEQVGHACGAGTGCGACQGVIEEMIEERRCGSCPRRRSASWSPYASTPEAA